MAVPRPRPTLAMLVAGEQTRRALEYAVREHERQVAAQEEADMVRRLGPGTGPGGVRVRPPMNTTQRDAVVAPAGLAQTAPLHRQNPRGYAPGQQQVALTPAQQEALDAQHDYQADWMSRDEAGRLHLNRQSATERGMAPTPSAIVREIEREDANRYVPKPTNKPKPMKVRI